ncbi:hypothetical protein [Nitrospirillum amazonense]|uniref:hypothetical protein n=1 Tax=Nitrospirillum amazonense TaxID=28077 RepID=UPI002412C559|nr:hypothetical protein [Nitrospirillum amazonense]MDG3444635.1 hypothetical protein [Nitrospirillum amazonense]
MFAWISINGSHEWVENTPEAIAAAETAASYWRSKVNTTRPEELWGLWVDTRLITTFTEVDGAMRWASERNPDRHEIQIVGDDPEAVQARHVMSSDSMYRLAILKEKTHRHVDGTDRNVTVDITCPDGEVVRLICRNLADFGRVINRPLGGILIGSEWDTATGRLAATPAEIAAASYLARNWPVRPT